MRKVLNINTFAEKNSANFFLSYFLLLWLFYYHYYCYLSLMKKQNNSIVDKIIINVIFSFTTNKINRNKIFPKIRKLKRNGGSIVENFMVRKTRLKS